MAATETTSIKPRRLFMEVSQRLERMISEGVYKPGDKLPTEQELAEKYDVSRNVIREAYKSCMERGLLTIKQGKGTFVTPPSPNLVSQALNRYFIRMDKRQIAALYEIRRILEIAGVELAAKKANEKDLEEMEICVEKMRKFTNSRDEWSKADLAFHIAITKSTHNDLFPVLLEPIAGYLLEVFSLGYQADDAIESGLKHHSQIIQRIRAHDSVGAKKYMLAHLKNSEKWLKKILLSE